MVNVFNSEIASKIDMRKTIANGKEVFLLYQPLVEKRLKQLSKIPINSASIVVCSNSSGLKSTDSKLIDRLSWNNDQIALFIKNIMNIKSFDPLIGEYLKLKCFDRLSDDAIARRINVSLRSVANYKSKAFYYLAIYTNQVEFIEERVYQFYLD